MPMNRKLLGAAAFSLALAGGGAAGVILGTPNLSLAQDSGTSDETPADAPTEGFRFHRGGEQLDVAAEAIGISVEDLVAALQDGQSIAQVAEANGVDPQTVIDAMVAAATERLESAIDELPDRMTEVVEREGFPDRPGGPGFGRGHFGAGLDAAAEAIGIESEELRTALRDGQTIAEVAEANDVAVQTVVDALVADAEAAIDQAVEDGHLDEDRAAEIKANLPERIEAMVNGDFRFGDHGGPGFGGPPPADDDATTPEGSSTAA